MATTGADPIFLDTNVLVYANVAESPKHDQALRTIRFHQSRHAEIWISRQILREYIAVLTRPGVFSNPPPVETVLERARQFGSTFRVADETAAVTDRLLQLLAGTRTGGRQTHDANIVATMLSVGVRSLVTDNVGDFRRFGNLIEIVPIDAVDRR